MLILPSHLKLDRNSTLGSNAESVYRLAKAMFGALVNLRLLSKSSESFRAVEEAKVVAWSQVQCHTVALYELPEAKFLEETEFGKAGLTEKEIEVGLDRLEDHLNIFHRLEHVIDCYLYFFAYQSLGRPTRRNTSRNFPEGPEIFRFYKRFWCRVGFDFPDDPYSLPNTSDLIKIAKGIYGRCHMSKGQWYTIFSHRPDQRWDAPLTESQLTTIKEQINLNLLHQSTVVPQSVEEYTSLPNVAWMRLTQKWKLIEAPMEVSTLREWDEMWKQVRVAAWTERGANMYFEEESYSDKDHDSTEASLARRHASTSRARTVLSRRQQFHYKQAVAFSP